MRRLHLTLDLHADDLDAVYGALQSIAADLDHDGRERRNWTSGGARDGFHLSLTVTDPDMNAERYREAVKAWMDDRRASRGSDAEARRGRYVEVNIPSEDEPDLVSYPEIFCKVEGCQWRYEVASWDDLSNDADSADWNVLHPSHEPAKGGQS